jgi:hypothetical protein
MSQADLDINRCVRTVLVKHWIDLGRLSVRSNDGKLYIRGSLQRIAGVNEELTSPIVDAMFADIKRIKNVRQVYPALENWSNDTGSWSPIGGAKSPQGGQQQAQKPAEVFEIKNKEGAR